MAKTPAAWPDRVRRRVARWLDGPAPRRWVVAVSGGPDSVALLRVLHAEAPPLGLDLVVAHLDHGARPEAAEDAAFVAELAGRLGLDCVVEHWSPTRPAHFEADARAARYAWLGRLARERGASAVAVGHTRDDQAETVLHRVVRGTGLRGLAGIPARRRLGPGVILARPLLDVTRAEIVGLLDALGQPYRVDASNADTSRTRARIRHELLPALADAYNPAVADALARLAGLAGAAERALARERRRLRASVSVPTTPGAVALARPALCEVAPSLAADLIRDAWRAAGWPEREMDARRWRRLATLARNGRPARSDAGAGVVAEVRDGVLVLRRGPVPEAPADVPAPVALPIPGVADWPGGAIVAWSGPDGPLDELIDADALIPPLVVRAPGPGDRFAPLGLDGHSMPLADFLRGRRVPRPDRATVPLVCDADGIVWVVGHRIADRVKITPDTARTVALSRARGG